MRDTTAVANGAITRPASEDGLRACLLPCAVGS